VAQSLIALRDVLVRHGEHTALEVSRLEIQAGEVLALLGPNGAGKTTLLRVIGLLQLPGAGKVYFNGTEAGGGNALATRQRIANVFQEPLLLNATVYQNAALGLKLRGFGRREIDMRLHPWLERLGIAHLSARSARTLSGGEAQRTSLARALVLEPELLLLDEPFSALDSASRQTLLNDFQRIVRQTKVTTVFVTHDPHEAFALSDRVGVLKQGRVLQLGSREDVFFRPQTESVAEITGIENRLSGSVECVDGDDATVVINDSRIYARSELEAGARVVACIRADDVTVMAIDCETKNQNGLKGRIIDVCSNMAQDRIVVDCKSFQLTALIDRKESQVFSEGDEVTARFNLEAVHIIRKD
jgi:tungstate transport system ATP-binding protein